jgi:nitronate monooxygenase
MSSPLLHKLGIRLPIIQAPMAGISTPAMAAVVSNAGGLGSIGVGNVDVAAARAMIADVRQRTDKPFNVNVFCHAPAVRNAKREANWLNHLAPHFRAYNAAPPAALNEIYKSFREDDEMATMLVEERPAVVSFHFGLPKNETMRAIHNAGIVQLANATNLREAQVIHAAGVDAIVAQGYEAGGHRGMFDPRAEDECLSTAALVQLLVKELPLPIIAAGGIMNGADIAAALSLGASAAQLGTAFVACPESSADSGYRAALLSDASQHTVMTTAISGRPAR